MAAARGLVVLFLLFLWIYCVLDARAADPARVRALPKRLWQVVTLVPVVGSLLWLLAGKPTRTKPRRGAAPSGPTLPSNPDDDAVFLEQLRRRAEEQRRKAEEERRRKDEGGEPTA